MAIQSKAAIEAEYSSKRDAILAYQTSSLDDDLAKLEVLATRVEECLAILAAREAVNSRPTSTPTIGAISEAASQLRRILGLVRGYVGKVKAELGSIDNPTTP